MSCSLSVVLVFYIAMSIRIPYVCFLEVFCGKTRVQLFGVFLDDQVQCVHKCGETTEVLEYFMKHASVVQSNGRSSLEVSRHIGLVTMQLYITIRVYGAVSMCA